MSCIRFLGESVAVADLLLLWPSNQLLEQAGTHIAPSTALLLPLLLSSEARHDVALAMAMFRTSTYPSCIRFRKLDNMYVAKPMPPLSSNCSLMASEEFVRVSLHNPCAAWNFEGKRATYPSSRAQYLVPDNRLVVDCAVQVAYSQEARIPHSSHWFPSTIAPNTPVRWQRWLSILCGGLGALPRRDRELKRHASSVLEGLILAGHTDACEALLRWKKRALMIPGECRRLHEACAVTRSQKISHLLQRFCPRGALPTSSLLRCAISINDTGRVRQLLSQLGAEDDHIDLSSADENIFLAATSGPVDIETIKLLCERSSALRTRLADHGVGIYSTLSYMSSYDLLLKYCVVFGNVEFLQFLFEISGVKKWSAESNKFQEKMMSLFTNAISHGQVKSLRFLIGKHPELWNTYRVERLPGIEVKSSHMEETLTQL